MQEDLKKANADIVANADAIEKMASGEIKTLNVCTPFIFVPHLLRSTLLTLGMYLSKVCDLAHLYNLFLYNHFIFYIFVTTLLHHTGESGAVAGTM